MRNPLPDDNDEYGDHDHDHDHDHDRDSNYLDQIRSIDASATLTSLG